MIRVTRAAAPCAPLAICVLLALCAPARPEAQATGQASSDAAAKERISAAAAAAEADPELANHLGFFKSRPLTAGSYGKLVAAANIVTSITGTRTSPDDLNDLANREKLFSENIYGASVVLDGRAMCRLLSLATKERYSVSLAYRVEGEVPNEEALEAEASADLFVTLAYLDRVPMIESGIAWSPTGEMQRVRVVNPLSAAGGPVPYKARSEYDPRVFDAWEFYRFRKTTR
jgi:hypothetical protein